MNYQRIINILEQIFMRIIAACGLAPRERLGRPRANISLIFRGILYMLIKGSTWRGFERRYGTRSTAHRYFSQWAAAGVFRELWKIFTETLINEGICKLKIQTIDASDKPVKGMFREFTSIGYKYKNKFAIKLTIMSTENGIPLALDICDAAQNDSKRLKFQEQAREDLCFAQAFFEKNINYRLYLLKKYLLVYF